MKSIGDDSRLAKGKGGTTEKTAIQPVTDYLRRFFVFVVGGCVGLIISFNDYLSIIEPAIIVLH